VNFTGFVVSGDGIRVFELTSVIITQISVIFKFSYFFTQRFHRVVENTCGNVENLLPPNTKF
jgi:hypothetical protein